MVNASEKIRLSALRFLVPLDLSQTYELIVSEGMKLVGADYGSILLEKKGKLQRVYASDPAFYKIKIQKGDLMYEVLKKKQPLPLTRQEIAKIHPEIKQTPVNSDIIIPLSYRNKTVGILTLMSSKEKAFAKKELNMVKHFAPLASLAIIKAQLDDETKKALEARDLFISMAAHELRTPLTTINGYIQMLCTKFGGTNTSEAHWVEELSRECFRLMNLVSELLQIEHARNGKLQYSWKQCSLAEVVNRARLNFRFSHPDYKIIFYNKLENCPDLVIGDFDKLMQVTTNLLDNAVKFSSFNTPITVHLKSESPHLILTVKDQGTGIARRDCSQIFKRFFRGSKSRREGMGLGLFLVKNIIEQHHGKIKIHSKENQGTAIEVKLPALRT